MNKILKIILAIFFFTQFSYGDDYTKEAKEIQKKFIEVIELYKNGKNTEAVQLTQEAYFGHFEFLEAGIRINLGQKKSYAMEKQFGDIRKAIKNQKPIEEIQAIIDNLNNEITEILPTIQSGHKLVAQKSDDTDLNDISEKSQTSQNPWLNVYENIKNELQNANGSNDTASFWCYHK